MQKPGICTFRSFRIIILKLSAEHDFWPKFEKQPCFQLEDRVCNIEMLDVSVFMICLHNTECQVSLAKSQTLGFLQLFAVRFKNEA